MPCVQGGCARKQVYRFGVVSMVGCEDTEQIIRLRVIWVVFQLLQAKRVGRLVGFFGQEACSFGQASAAGGGGKFACQGLVLFLSRFCLLCLFCRLPLKKRSRLLQRLAPTNFMRSILLTRRGRTLMRNVKNETITF